MKYSAHDFRRIPVLHTAVIGSACIFCKRVVAYSPNPDMLHIAEKAHCCCKKLLLCAPAKAALHPAA